MVGEESEFILLKSEGTPQSAEYPLVCERMVSSLPAVPRSHDFRPELSYW